MTTDPDWFGGDVAIAGGRDELACLHGQLVWTSTGDPLTEQDLERLRAAGEADPAAVWRFFLDAAGLDPA
jgi:hypothetical protein